jgi:hypothetical protein
VHSCLLDPGRHGTRIDTDRPLQGVGGERELFRLGRRDTQLQQHAGILSEQTAGSLQVTDGLYRPARPQPGHSQPELRHRATMLPDHSDLVETVGLVFPLEQHPG